MRDPSRAWAGIRLTALAFGSQPIKAWAPYQCRTVYFVGGIVPDSVPLILHYRKRRKQALRLARRLKRWGYSSVKVRRERERESNPDCVRT